MTCGRKVFLVYGLGAKRLSEIWFGCETSFWNIVWVRNVFLKYEDGGETSFLFMARGRNVVPKYELGAKRLTKKWCELTMGRKICVPSGRPFVVLHLCSDISCPRHPNWHSRCHRGLESMDSAAALEPIIINVSIKQGFDLFSLSCLHLDWQKDKFQNLSDMKIK